LLYVKVLDIPTLFPARTVKGIFNTNNWRNSWYSGIYTFHHYHSITHEVMGVCKGKTTLMLGGEEGTLLTISKGDVLIIPAGVAHKNMQREKDVMCVGAYPDGRDYDIKKGLRTERPEADLHIAMLELPKADPVFGSHGELQRFWK